MKVRGFESSLTLPLSLTKSEATQRIPVPLWSSYADLEDHAAPHGAGPRDFAIVDLASHDD
jgi:hypothetical protein